VNNTLLNANLTQRSGRNLLSARWYQSQFIETSNSLKIDKLDHFYVILIGLFVSISFQTCNLFDQQKMDVFFL